MDQGRQQYNPHHHDLGAAAQRGTKRKHVCEDCCRDFKTKYLFDRHKVSAEHVAKAGVQPIEQFRCGWKGCTSVFPRKDRLKRHYEEVHLGKSRQPSVAVRKDSLHSAAESALIARASFDAHLNHDDAEDDWPRLPDCQTDNYASTHDGCGDDAFAFLPTEPNWELFRDVPGYQSDLANTLRPSSLSLSSLNIPIVSDWALHNEDQNNAGRPARSVSPDLGSTAPSGAYLPPVTKYNRSPWPRIRSEKPCVLCSRPFGTNGEEVKAHVDKHLLELGYKSQDSKCNPCDITFMLERDLRYHLARVRKDMNCGFSFEHRNKCEGHHPPSDPEDHELFEKQKGVWELTQQLAYSLQIRDHAEKTARTNAPEYGKAAPAYRRSMGSLNSQKIPPSKHSVPTHVQFAGRGFGGRNVKALRNGLETVRSHVSGTSATSSNETHHPGLKDKVVEALRQCDTGFLNSLLAGARLPGQDDSDEPTWSVFELLDRCAEEDYWLKSDIKIADVLACFDILVKDGRVTRSETAELAAGHNAELFAGYLHSGTQVDVSHDLIEGAFCKAIFRGDHGIVTSLLNQGAARIVTRAARFDCLHTKTQAVDPHDSRTSLLTGIYQRLRPHHRPLPLPSYPADHAAIAALLIAAATIVGKYAALLQGVARNPCAENVVYMVKHEACAKCAEHYRVNHHSWYRFATSGHAHRLCMLSRPCAIDQLTVRLARCFLPRVARYVLAQTEGCGYWDGIDVE